MMRADGKWLFIVGLTLTLLAAPFVQAQSDGTASPATSSEGLDVEVEQGGLVLIQMAIPRAINLDSKSDTIGLTEALSGTVKRDLTISSFFNILKPAQILAKSDREGMKPVYRDWFNSGAQGLIKISYKQVGKKVIADFRLFSVEGSDQVVLPKPFDGPIRIDASVKKLRAMAHEFANEVIGYYTKTRGFFGTQIVFVKGSRRTKEIYMMSADGVEETGLTGTRGINMLPSMGAGRLYFTSFRRGGPHAFRLGSGSTRPFAAYPGLNTGAVLSPDGSSVALTLSRDGNPEIYLLHPDTGKIKRRLTNSEAIDTSPAWSPDGQRIAFVSDRHGSPQIFVMNANGGGVQRLTFQGDYNQTPDWNPKSGLIAFTARDERAIFDIFTVDVGTKEIKRLTQNQGNNEEPTWSPDGRFIAFSSTRSGTAKIYLMDQTGRYQHKLSTGTGAYLTPFWVRY
ncbi:MAG: translocation protein TolB [Myxococcales bacterium]|nr:translocation protein TolB [Myxococcales bacterium]